MPWWGLVYDERDIKDGASKLHGVSGIPMLVCMKSDGTKVSNNYRGKISSSGAEALNNISWFFIDLN